MRPRPAGRVRRYVTLLAVMLLVACSQPPYDEIEAEFVRAHPDVEVLSVGPGEGDSGNVYVHVRYLRGEREHEEVCLWQWLEGRWTKTGYCSTT